MATTKQDSRGATATLPPVPFLEFTSDDVIITRDAGFGSRVRTYSLAALEAICTAKGGEKCALENMPLDKYVARFEILFVNSNDSRRNLEGGPWAFDSLKTAQGVASQWVTQCHWEITTFPLNVPEKDRTSR
jgi:hypothetical protein